MLRTAVKAVTTPTTFDLCGHTLLCRETINFPEGRKVAIKNGNVHVPKGLPAGLTVFDIKGGEVSFKNIIIGRVLEESESKLVDTLSFKYFLCEYHPRDSYIGIQMHDRAIVFMHSCEIWGAEHAVHISDRSYKLIMGCIEQVPTSRFVASHVKLLNPVGGRGLITFGMATAELTDCVISSKHCDISVTSKGQLIATRVEMPWHVCVSGGSSARMFNCRFTNTKESYSRMLVWGRGSHLSLVGCVWYEQQVIRRIRAYDGGQFSIQ